MLSNTKDPLSDVDEALKYLEKKAPVLWLRVSRDGKILAANRYAKTVTGRTLIDDPLSEIVVDLSPGVGPSALPRDDPEEHVLHVETASGPPRSFYFSFVEADNGFSIFGRPEAEEQEIIRQVLTLNQELSNLTRALHKKNAQLEAALSQVKTLSGLLPICSHCKSVRDDKGYWKQIEAYIGKHSDATFSHSICPDCAKKLYPDFDLYKES
jgi:hypothetical protein